MSGDRVVGVLGGTFDPIHLGHLAAAEDARVQLDLDEILFVPNNVPPHKQNQAVTPSQHRVRMVELAIADNSNFRLCTIELQRPGPSFTLDTLRLLRREYGGDARLVFLTGCDSLHGLHTWHQPDVLLDEFGIVLLDRPTDGEIDWVQLESRFPKIRRQTRIVPIPLLDISSHDLRQRARKGLPIRYYVTPPVEKYILETGLYYQPRDP